MWMTQYVMEVKRRLRDEYGFQPSRVVGSPPNEDLVFDNVPDGEYPMTIEGKLDRVRVVNGRFNFEDDKVAT